MDVNFALEVSGRAYLEYVHPGRTKIELTKGAKGAYRWTVEVSDVAPDKALQVTTSLERALAKQYGGEVVPNAREE